MEYDIAPELAHRERVTALFCSDSEAAMSQRSHEVVRTQCREITQSGGIVVHEGTSGWSGRVCRNVG